MPVSLSGSWGRCWSLFQLLMGEGRLHFRLTYLLISILCEQLSVQYLAQRDLSIATKVFRHLPRPEHLPCFCLHWGLNRVPSSSQPSPQQAELTLPVDSVMMGPNRFRKICAWFCHGRHISSIESDHEPREQRKDPIVSNYLTVTMSWQKVSHVFKDFLNFLNFPTHLMMKTFMLTFMLTGTVGKLALCSQS